MLEYLLIGFFFFFPRTETSSPVFSAVIVLALGISVWLWVSVFVLKRIHVIDIVPSNTTKILGVSLYLFLVAILIHHFSKLKWEELSKEVDSLPDKVQLRWACSSLLFLILPMVLIGLMFAFRN
jgi:hypothetical protein